MSKEYLAKVEVISYCGTKQITLVNDALTTTGYCSDLLCWWISKQRVHMSMKIRFKRCLQVGNSPKSHKNVRPQKFKKYTPFQMYGVLQLFFFIFQVTRVSLTMYLCISSSCFEKDKHSCMN